MTAKHQTAEYQRNARIIRSRTKQQLSAGVPVVCWRCRSPIYPSQTFDVGHIAGAQGSSQNELAPEHRSRTTNCKGNRSHGGTQGANIANSRRTSNGTKTWPL